MTVPDTVPAVPSTHAPRSGSVMVISGPLESTISGPTSSYSSVPSTSTRTVKMPSSGKATSGLSISTSAVPSTDSVHGSSVTFP